MTEDSGSPPSSWQRLLRLAAPGRERDAIAGDLDESYRYDLFVRGWTAGRAARAYRREVIRSVWPLLVSRIDLRTGIRFATTIGVAVMITAWGSFLVGELLAAWFPSRESAVRLVPHLAVVIAATPLVGLVTCRLSGVDARLTICVLALLLVWPAAVAPWQSGYVAPRVAWIVLVPIFTLAGGLLGSRSPVAARG